MTRTTDLESISSNGIFTDDRPSRANSTPGTGVTPTARRRQAEAERYRGITVSLTPLGKLLRLTADFDESLRLVERDGLAAQGVANGGLALQLGSTFPIIGRVVDGRVTLDRVVRSMSDDGMALAAGTEATESGPNLLVA